AVKLLEDPWPLLGRDSEALVSHGEARVFAAYIHADGHRSSVRRVLDRVFDEVDEHLPHLVPISGDEWDMVWGVDLQRYPLRRVCSRRLHDALYQFDGVERLEFEVEPPCFELVRQQDFVDDPAETL